MQSDWRVLGEDWIASPATVVVGVDGSGRDRSALVWAAAEAARLGDDLLLVTVVDDSLLVSPRASLAMWRTHAEEVLDDAARVVDGTLPADNVHRLVLAGDPAVCLARSFPDVRLVVVGKRGLGAFQRMLVGSTSLGLVARSDAPVVVVPDEWQPGRSSRGPVVVAGVPDDEDRKLALASARASRLGVPLIALHAEERGELSGEAVLRAAAGAQLVVIGRTAHAALPGVLLGSTVRTVLHRSECPVMVVPELDTQEGMDMNSRSDSAVLVAIDEGERRHVALEFGARQALAEGRRLHLVHVVHPLTRTFGAGAAAEIADAMTAATTLLEDAATLAREITGGRVHVATSALQGYPLEVLLHAAAGSDRIVLQRRHLSPLDNLINGPVVAGVSARADVPVLVVPETAPGWGEPGRRLVTVAVKRWDRDAELFDRAFDAAAVMGARLRVLSVVTRSHLEGRQHQRELVSAAELHLREQVRDRHVRHPELDVEVVVRVGKPALVLLEASAESDLMLISRPPSHLRANALGTLSRALLREAVCAVEVVPAPAKVLATAGPTPHPRVGADAWGPIY